jgi:class 3 adenylate cyclase
LTEQHPQIRVRIGLHCGPVTAGVIGTERLQYDVWGDTVNVASRMESHGEPGRIHVSEAFANALTSCLPDTLTLFKRGLTEVKGKGPMTTYWLETT